uniref:Eukaryotic translation initiation factor 3 30 kDa subunit n=1 Tax=Pyramimonas obovata TaxID=1411642 RepID=A0A7S0R2T1_9CHLO|eukprot:CAMPEP_0118956538 /NCGR_PEP_ID=MMETSP1169-20130426/61632_1 /TAXON_ID=36882 /ORGANISM="Pyramimonas obovata, Strain CCMP722" /LENGTH=222 /DNA_ID=CAMNT_0006904573 /DNA_START=56 /DNA_END=724 /DNA_ORIENTATION=+
MSDDGGNWDDDDFEIPELPKKEEPNPGGLDDEEEEEEQLDSNGVPKPKTKTKPGKKKYGDELKGGASGGDAALDDPLAEKLRQQRLVEESDFALANELFGDDVVDLEKFMPKSAKEFELYATMVAGKYLQPYKTSAHYVNMMKALLRKATQSLNSVDAKELEGLMGVIRNEKVKEEKPATKGKKAAKKAALNTRGADGGDLMAMTEDALYMNERLGDDYDFM